MKNRLINGAMVIDQRNAGASVTPNVSYTLDRWQGINTQASKFTVQQNAGSVTPPTGFTNYLGVTSSSAYSVLTGDTFLISQSIEGFNTADLDFGKSTAKTITLSFWVRSSLTGTFGGALTNNAGNRSYAFSYTISSANTWEQKTVTIAGDTTGTWETTTNAGIRVRFGLGSGSTYSGTAGVWSASDLVQSTGSTSVVGTNGATFYITGVQLEVGSTATSFDYRPYGTELQLCMRYYEKRSITGNANICMAIANAASGNTQTIGTLNLFVEKRTSPTVTTSAASTFAFGWLGGATTSNSILGSGGTLSTGTLLLGLPSGATQIAGYFTGSSSFLAFDSEL
jgi:hypothetical protein